MPITRPMGSVPGKKGGPGVYNGLDYPPELSKKGDSGPDTIPVKTMEDIPVNVGNIDTPFKSGIQRPKNK